jgi:hypothetical protein
MCTRVDPHVDTDFIRPPGAARSIPPFPKTKKVSAPAPLSTPPSPYEWAKDFPKAPAASEDLKKRVVEKHGKYLS